jgi:tropomyosin-1
MRKASAEVGLRRPALRRPKLENVEAAEAEKEAAIRAGTAVSLARKTNSRKSSSPTILPESEDLSKNVVVSNKLEGTLSHSGSSNSLSIENANDFSDLRCSSVRTEEVVEREKARRKNRCPDYPGLAFGAPLGFGSDTMMKFNIIKNELHNIMRSQLKRVDGEVC